MKRPGSPVPPDDDATLDPGAPVGDAPVDASAPDDAGTPSRGAGLAARLRDGWQSVRPTTRRGGALGLARIGLAAAAIAIAFYVGTGLVAATYTEFGFHPDADARTWASRQPSFANVALCASCHQTEHARLTSASHAGIGCESCHGALLDHAVAAQGSPPAIAPIAVPTDELCVKCHVKADGRPASFRQIVPTQHYVATCLQCHDPHTGISRRPPVVSHPLANLPPCLTCHGPEGFKARNQRHPTVATDDATCLACHATGRGPAEPGT